MCLKRVEKKKLLVRHNKVGKWLRSSHRKCSLQKGALRNFTKFTGKQLCQSLFFSKVTGLRPRITFL